MKLIIVLALIWDTTGWGLFNAPVLLAALVPIKIYSNAEADKAQIIKDNKNKSGIYKWKNLINDKQYIGSAIDLSKRLSNYYSTAYIEDALNRGISHIYRALLKNGHDNFSVTILEYCEPEKCIEREDFYLSTENHEYNILEKAGSSRGRKHDEKTKKKISDSMSGENHPMFEKPRPEGAGRPSQAIEVTNITNDTTTSYDSMHEAAKVLNLPSYRIIRNYIIRNQQKPYKGIYTFRFLKK